MRRRAELALQRTVGPTQVERFEHASRRCSNRLRCQITSIGVPFGILPSCLLVCIGICIVLWSFLRRKSGDDEFVNGDVCGAHGGPWEPLRTGRRFIPAPGCLTNSGGARDDLDEVLPVLYPCRGAPAEAAWLPEEMFGLCKIEVACIEDLVGAYFSGSNASLLQKYVKQGIVVATQTKQYPWVEAFVEERGVGFSSLVLIHLSDETKADQAEWAARYAQWHAAFRNHWVDDAVGSYQRLRDSRHLLGFPTGFTPQVRSLREDTRKNRLASARMYQVAFLGSAYGGRAAMLEELASEGLEVVHYNGSCYDCEDTGYLDALTNTAICLQLPGVSIECAKMYEALEAGCVPAIVEAFGANGTRGASRRVRMAYSHLEEVTGKRPPFIWALDPSDLAEKLQDVRTQGKLDAAQSAVRVWWGTALRYYRKLFASRICPTHGEA